MSSKSFISSAAPEANPTIPVLSFGTEEVDQIEDFELGMDEITFDEAVLNSFRGEMDHFIDVFETEIPNKEPSREFCIDALAECAVFIAANMPNQHPTFIVRQKPVNVTAEQGDDLISFTPDPMIPIMESRMAKILFGMVTSRSDTFLSRKFGNYTEKWIMMPQDRLDLKGITVDVKGGDKTTPVLDIPSLRATLSVDPQVRSNVNSIEGKMTLYARSLGHARGTADELLVWKASIFQDVLLGVGSKGDRFPYFPSSVGGYDKPVPMNNRENLLRAMSWWKRGRYRDLLMTIATRMYEVTHPDGGKFVRDPFLERVKSMYDGYSPTYVEYRRDMPLAKGKLPKEAMRYMIGEFSNNAGANAALRRLRASRLIVAERDIIIANEVESYVRALLSSDVKDFQELKTQREREYRTSVIFGRSFQILYKEFVQARLVRHMGQEVITFAMRMDLDSTTKIKNFLMGEKFFDREALDQIMIRGPTKVRFPLLVNGRKIDERTDEPALEIEEAHEAAILELYKWAKGEKVTVPPRSMLEDDDIIVDEIRMKVQETLNSDQIMPLLVLVTSDKELCRRINLEFSVVVVRIPPQLVKAVEVGLIKYDGTISSKTVLESWEGMFEPFFHKLKETLPAGTSPSLHVEEVLVEVDLGSWAAEMQKLDIFPFRKVQYASNRRHEYFEYRVPTEDAVENLKDIFNKWPLHSDFLFDQEGLTTLNSSSGNPLTTSLREVKRSRFPVPGTIKQMFSVPRVVTKAASKPISTVMSKARALFKRAEERPLSADPSPREQMLFAFPREEGE